MEDSIGSKPGRIGAGAATDGDQGGGRAYGALLALSAFAALGALLTLMPSPRAPWPNLIGYKSICAFAPGSTCACALVAALSCLVRARLVRHRRGRLALPIIVVAFLAAGLAVSCASYSKIMSKDVDGGSSASKKVGSDSQSIKGRASMVTRIDAGSFRPALLAWGRGESGRP
jgi:hypothetical protein